MDLLSPSLPRGSAALFLDVDGTLLDIASRPDAVVVTDTLRSALAELHAGLDGAIALVSGRAIADLDHLFAPLRLPASGVHGAELRRERGGDVQVLAGHGLPADLIAAIRSTAARYPGTLVEDKRFSAAIHYRAAADAGPALRSDLEALLARSAGEGCRILPGHMVFEIKRTGFDKGTAVGAFMRSPPFRGRHPIFIGDDITDLPGFAKAIEEGGFAYSVTTPRDGVSGHFTEPAAVRAWLQRACEHDAAAHSRQIDSGG